MQHFDNHHDDCIKQISQGNSLHCQSYTKCSTKFNVSFNNALSKTKEVIANFLFLLGKYLRYPLLWTTCNVTKIPVTIN